MNEIYVSQLLYKSSYNTCMHTIMLSTTQMRHCESAFLATGIAADAMLRHAGQTLARQLHDTIAAQQSIVVCAGPGNNGADGLVMAEVLHQCGHRVSVWYWRKPDMWLAALEAQGIPCHPGFAAYDALPPLESGSIIIDALLGIGVNRSVVGDLAAAVQWINQRPPAAVCVAIDVPSGCDADTGAVHSVAVRADRTLSAGPCKQGLCFLPAMHYAGRIDVCDVGIPLIDGVQYARRLSATDIAALLPVRRSDAHKYQNGKVLLWAGSAQYPGAAVLAATAALRSGAGLVSLAVPTAIVPLVWQQPELTLTTIDADIVATLAAVSADALVMGPGLGRAVDTVTAVRQLCATAWFGQRPSVIDADALTILAQAADWYTHLPARQAVLTPHLGELRRLCGGQLPVGPAPAIASQLAQQWQQVLVMKGSSTVIADADGCVAVWPYPNSVLAVGGSGDVLTGIIATFLAQGLSPFAAACAGVGLHGLTAAVLRAEVGDSGVLASDIVAYLPRVMQRLRTGASLPMIDDTRGMLHANL